MEIIYLMIPLAVIVATIIVCAFVWAVRNGQFDDLEGPANRILFDDDPQLKRAIKSDEEKGETKT